MFYSITMIDRWLTLFLFIVIVVSNSSLRCFECTCFLTLCNCKGSSDRNDNTHCIITRKNPWMNSIVHLTRINQNSTLFHINDPYYILLEESIIYNKKSKDWHIRPSDIVYGCDWDDCNDPKLIGSVSTSLKVTMNKTWLMTNIHGSGSAPKCYACSKKLCGILTFPIDFNQCSFQICNKKNLCILHSVINNITTDEQCFYSECASNDLNEQLTEKDDDIYKVRIKGLIYLTGNRSNFHLLELHVFCGSSNCSRPNIFQEIKEQLMIDTSNLTSFSLVRPSTTIDRTESTTVTTSVIDNLKCYTCSCNNLTCPCSTIEERSSGITHCTIDQLFIHEQVNTVLTHINPNSVQFYIHEYPYIFIQQSIIYNETIEDWISTIDLISYGCNWNSCNEPRLVPYLSNSIQIWLNKTWLYGTVSDTGWSTHHCNQCPNTSQCSPIDNLNLDKCSIQECNNTCFLSNIYNHVTSHEQCYQSSCSLPDKSIFGMDPYRVVIQGILYLNRSQLDIEVWQIHIPCRALNCSRSDIFQEVKDQLTLQVGDLNVFHDIVTTTPLDIVTTSTLSFYDRHSCNSAMLVPSLNGSCVSIVDAANEAINFLMNENNTGNVSQIANALTVYFGATTHLNSSQQLNKTLTPHLIDTLLGVLNTSITQNSSTSFIMCGSVIESNMPLGVSFQSTIGGQIIYNSSETHLINSSITAAAIISPQSLINNDIIYVNMLVIDKPPIEYHRLNNSKEKILSSSIIVAKILSAIDINVTTMNITIYLTILPDMKHDTNNGQYYCSFYDPNTSNWNESGCTNPIWNSPFQRYECSCNHLTSFALVWLPNTIEVLDGKSLNAEDIVSIIFQLISIICFVCILIDSLIRRRIHIHIELEARDLLPLISCASTILVFIFYIILGLTVYTQTESFEQIICFQSARILMFTVYFLLIFMFCTKTSVGYFNYLRFVHPLPAPSVKRLRTLMILSLLISSIYLTFAIGFDSNHSFHITKLYPYQICWFTPNVIHYFLTIPIGFCLLLNTTMIILVGKCLITHSRNVKSPNQSNKRMKMSIIVLLSSCVTQGIAWLVGPLLSFMNSTDVTSLTWLFIIFNGLEGLWSILLYLTIRTQQIEDNSRSTVTEALTRLSALSSHPYKRKS